MLFRLSRYDFRFPRYRRVKRKVIFNRLPQTRFQSRLKLEKLWIAITPKIMTRGQRMNDHQKRGIFTFKTLFDSSRYDFRFPRYRRVKRKIIFNRLLSPSSSDNRISRSRSPDWPIPNSRQSTDAIPRRVRSTHFQEKM